MDPAGKRQKTGGSSEERCPNSGRSSDEHCESDKQLNFICYQCGREIPSSLVYMISSSNGVQKPFHNNCVGDYFRNFEATNNMRENEKKQNDDRRQCDNDKSSSSGSGTRSSDKQ